MTKALTVETVEIRLLQISGSVVIITVGTVPTCGWTNPRLVPYIYKAPPQDGIYDLDLVANPPTDLSAQIVSPIATSLAIPNKPDWLKGVRIHSSLNSMEAMISDSKPIEFQHAGVQLQWEGDLPWPDIFRVTSGTIIGNG